MLQFSWARDFTRHDGTLPMREDVVDQAVQLQPEGLGQDNQDFVPHEDGDDEGEEEAVEEGGYEDDMDN